MRNYSLLVTLLLTLPLSTEARMSRRATIQQGQEQIERHAQTQRSLFEDSIALKMKRFSSPLYPVHFDHPETWEIKYDQDDENTNGHIYTSRPSAYDYESSVHISWSSLFTIARDNPPHYSPKEWMQMRFDSFGDQPENLYEEDHKAFIPDYEKIESSQGEVFGYPANFHVYTTKFLGKHHKIRLIRVLTDTYEYTISYKADVDYFDTDREIYEKIFDSIVLASNTSSSTTTNTTSTLHFSDVPSSHRNHRAIERLKELRIVQGYDGGGFKPGAPINRAEFTKIVMGAIGEGYDGGNCFPDVTDQWFAPFVCAAKAQGIIGGYPDGTFGPERSVTFAEAAKIIAGAFALELDQETSVWYERFVRSLSLRKAIPVDIAAFNSPLTRAQMAEMIYRLYDGIEGESKGYEEF